MYLYLELKTNIMTKKFKTSDEAVIFLLEKVEKSTLTKKELADKSEMSASQLSNLISSKSAKFSTISKVAKSLGFEATISLTLKNEKNGLQSNSISD